MLVGSPAARDNGRRLQEQWEPWADIEQPVERQHLATTQPCELILVNTAATPQGESHFLSYLQGQHASIPGSPQQTRQAQHHDSITVQNTMQSDKARSTPSTQDSQSHRARTACGIFRGIETSRCCIPATLAAHAQPDKALGAPMHQLMAGPADRQTDAPLAPSFAANGPPSEPRTVCQPPGAEAGNSPSQARLGYSASNMLSTEVGVTAAQEIARSSEIQQTQNGQVPSKGPKFHKWRVQRVPSDQLSEQQREEFRGKAELALEVEE